MSEPIPHHIRVSLRARNVCFRMSIRDGLQVVVPRGYDLRNIPQLLERKRRWIESTERRFARHRTEFPFEQIKGSPAQIILPAINEVWQINYRPRDVGSVLLRQTGPDCLTLSGNLASALACERVLQRWLRRRGQDTLVPWLLRVSHELNLPFGKAVVRLQKSRWGSCSRTRTISLNAKLLFLNPDVVRYLLIHELCHTVHMNHSAAYWRFVASNEPEWRRLDQAIRMSMRSVPRWASK